jgi:hypothetical protein
MGRLCEASFRSLSFLRCLSHLCGVFAPISVALPRYFLCVSIFFSKVLRVRNRSIVTVIEKFNFKQAQTQRSFVLIRSPQT